MKSRDLKDFDQHRAKLPRTDFDMAQIFTFTSSTGMILPVYQDFLNAGDSVHFSGRLFSRTQPMVTAAMVDVDFFVDWFFVPASMLYTAFTNLRYQTNDFISSFYTQGIFSVSQLDGNFPLLDTNTCLTNQPLSSSESGYNNYYFDCFGKARFRLANHFGFNPYGVFDGDQTYDLNNLPNVDNPNVFPMFALAYQAIYHKYFRLDEWEPLSVSSYNWDMFFPNAGSLVFNPSADPFVLRYRPYRRDYFKQVFSSPLLNSVNLQGRGSSFSNPNFSNPLSILERVNGYLTDTSQLGVSSNETRVTVSPNDPNFSLTDIRAMNDQNSSSFVHSIAQLRNLFAVDKLLRITNKAKKDYDSQMLAHFGVKIPHDVKHDLTHLGCDKAVLHVGEVVSTSDTYSDTGSGSGSALGEIAGKGYVSINGDKRKFTAPVDGVFMAVVSAVPRLSYYNTIDKQNAFTSRLDLYTPEFDRLGAQPLFGYETNMSYVGNSSRCGWQYRYSQWKLKYDRCTEAFRIPRSNAVNHYSAWINSYSYFTGHTDPSLDGVQLFDAFGPGTINNYFYCSPHDLDQIMAVQYTSVWNESYSISPWLMFNTDPFINQFAADVTKVSVMSHTGEPLMD